MRKTLVAGNWKMHGTRTSVAALLESLQQRIPISDHLEVAVFPPFVFLELTEQLLGDSKIVWGAQNLASELAGAYTGEVSAAMLKEYACHYVLVGHSERRTLYHETDEVVAKKFVLAKQQGLQPILCVGETLVQRQAGETEAVVRKQVASVLEKANDIKIFEDAVIAYEPVWAIGTGHTATPEQAQQVHARLRHDIAEYSPAIAEKLRILYGGSVKAAHAKALFAMPDIDGGLVGGASLDIQEFSAICAAA